MSLLDTYQTADQSSQLFEFINNDSVDPTTLPVRKTIGSAGFDLYAAETIVISGFEGSIPVHTNIRVNLPVGTFGKLEMRSSLAVNEHLAIGAGVIDQDYHGEIIVVVYCVKANHKFTITKGTRFAQFILYPNLAQRLNLGVENTVSQIRGDGGFGSTGHN